MLSLRFAVALGLLGALAAGLGACSKSETSKITTGSALVGDKALGKQIFAANCAICHGATGKEGGVGPSLLDEHERKSAPEAVAWIKDPQPPMPRLYPAPLSDQDVANVAAYIESL